MNRMTLCGHHNDFWSSGLKIKIQCGPMTIKQISPKSSHTHSSSMRMSIDHSHKSHNASVLYPTMHHFVTEMCTYVHISVTKWCIVGYLSDALWDLWDRSIASDGYFNINVCNSVILNNVTTGSGYTVYKPQLSPIITFCFCFIIVISWITIIIFENSTETC